MPVELERDQQSHLEQHIVVVDDERCELVLRHMRLLIVIAAMGGFLSGYNTGVLSGVLLPLTHVHLWTCGRTKGSHCIIHHPLCLFFGRPFAMASSIIHLWASTYNLGGCCSLLYRCSCFASGTKLSNASSGRNITGNR
jgi:hypothetical protein